MHEPFYHHILVALRMLHSVKDEGGFAKHGSKVEYIRIHSAVESSRTGTCTAVVCSLATMALPPRILAEKVRGCSSVP